MLGKLRLSPVSNGGNTRLPRFDCVVPTGHRWMVKIWLDKMNGKKSRLAEFNNNYSYMRARVQAAEDAALYGPLTLFKI
jgi:hypothetical protein